MLQTLLQSAVILSAYAVVIIALATFVIAAIKSSKPGE